MEKAMDPTRDGQTPSWAPGLHDTLGSRPRGRSCLDDGSLKQLRRKPPEARLGPGRRGGRGPSRKAELPRCTCRMLGPAGRQVAGRLCSREPDETRTVALRGGEGWALLEGSQVAPGAFCRSADL